VTRIFLRRLRLLLTAYLLGAAFCHAASVAETQSFLRDHRHAWLPYPWPEQATTNELARLLDYDFDTIGLSFTGSYHAGHIDFSTLDTAIGMVAAKGKKAVLDFAPGFDPSDNVFDRISDGSLMTNIWNRSPNYAMIDVFDPRQRELYCRYLELAAQRYGKDPRVAGFVVGWGYMGETGYFIGDYLADFSRLGSVVSGYSDFALVEFNRWRKRQHLPALTKLPKPSMAGPDRDYILFHRFRSEFAGDVFQKEAVARVRALTRKPVGTFGYTSVSAANYGRDWAPTPNVDFYRSAVFTASYDLHRTLLDSAMGWEDSELQDGPWQYSVACAERNLARSITRGAVVHAMPIRDYAKPWWETNFFPRLASFLITQKIAGKVREAPVETALFQPTWSYSALPARGPTNLFAPRVDQQMRSAKMIGLVESFGVPYKLITERDLLNPRELRRYKHIIVPLWDLMPLILDEKSAVRLAADRRVVPILTGTKQLPRSEFRDLLRRHQVPVQLDFDSEKILAGRINNLIVNYNDKPLPVRIGDNAASIILQPAEFRFLP
jgi:hypothetical protein